MAAYLTKTLGTPTDNLKWTFSGWIKISGMSGDRGIFALGDNSTDFTRVNMNGNGAIEFDNKVGSTFDGRRMTSAYHRDPAAWYHIVAVFDSANATADDKMILYVNGSRITALGTDIDPSASAASGNTSSKNVRLSVMETSSYFTGNMAHVHFCDGYAYAASDFGETDSTSGIWIAKTSPSVSYGNNGFFLKFQDTSAFGDDSSGNNNDMTMSGTITQTKDTPDNNFCTMNPLDNYFNDASFSNGDTTIYTDGGAVYTYNTATYHLSTGKWYWEVKVAAGTNGAGTSYEIGIADTVSAATSEELGHEVTQWAYYGAGHIRTGNANTGTYSTYTAGDIIGVYLDLDNNKLYFAKNGTIENSGTGVSITAPADLANAGYFPAACYFDGDGSSNAAYFHHNFGNGYFGTTAVSSSVADAGGEGSFEYDPSSGTFDGSSKDFRALCTNNLATYG